MQLNLLLLITLPALAAFLVICAYHAGVQNERLRWLDRYRQLINKYANLVSTQEQDPADFWKNEMTDERER